MEVSINIDIAAVRAQLERSRTSMDRALELAMKDATSYLLARVRVYPPPPDPIQGPANVPVRTFTTKGGASVRLRANKMTGKGISMASAESLRYKRTNTLYRSWSTFMRDEGGTLVGGVGSNGNIAPYNVYVQGPLTGKPGQANIHRGRWESVDEIRERSESRIQEMFRARVEAAIAQG